MDNDTDARVQVAPRAGKLDLDFSAGSTSLQTCVQTYV